MIDLTPLDVRKKRGDFGKGLRGYDPLEVDGFLELVAERMEELVIENLAFREQVEQLGERVAVQEGREQAVQAALVTAQELRQDVKEQARREAELLEREAQGRIEGMVLDSEKLLREHHKALQELERQRERFLKSFRTLLERQLDTVEVEIGRAPLEDVTFDLDLGKSRFSRSEEEYEEEEEEEERVAEAEDDAGRVEDLSASESAETPDAAVGSDDPPGAESVSPEKAGGATGPDQQRPPEGQEGADSLWLSSIMSEREEKNAE